jgi:MORN repeat
LSDGFGIYRSIYGDVYEGYYKEDKRHGKGKLKTCMGTTFVDEWIDGIKKKKGVASCIIV